MCLINQSLNIELVKLCFCTACRSHLYGGPSGRWRDQLHGGAHQGPIFQNSVMAEHFSDTFSSSNFGQQLFNQKHLQISSVHIK
jgi:hypothetical protein